MATFGNGVGVKNLWAFLTGKSANICLNVLDANINILDDKIYVSVYSNKKYSCWKDLGLMLGSSNPSI